MSAPTGSPTPVVLGGTFISQDSPPTFRVQANHPIAKFLRGNADIKKMQLLHSNKVEGIIFVSNNKVSTLYLGHLAYDDAAEEIPVVAGALGSLCHNSFPVAIPMQDLLAETLIALPRVLPVTSSFLYGKPLSDAFFCTDDDQSKPLSRSDPSQDYSLISFPLCLPKLRGQPIVEGSLQDDNVVASLHNYHPDAGEWVDAHIAILKTPTAIVSKDPFAAIDESFLPQMRPSIPITTTTQISLHPLFDSGEDSTSLRFQVQDLIDQHKQTNTDRFYTHHPTLAPPTVHQLVEQTQTPSPNQRPTQLAKASTDTFDILGISIHKKYRRALNTYKVILASVGDDKILCPPLRKEFLLAYSQASSQENSRYATTALKEHDLERAEHTRDYLQRLVSGLHWNHATTSLFLHAMFHTSPLDEHKEILKTSISFLTFLAPPPEQSSPELKEYLQSSYVEHMQAVVGESNEKKQKLSIKTFQGGLQNTPQDVLVGLANLESRLSFLVDYSQPETPKPLFIQWILQLAHIFSSPEFNNFYKKYSSTHKWIPHAMVTQIQMVFAMITKVATSLKVLTAIQNDLPLPLDTFALPIKAFSNLISDLHSIISGVGAGVYSTPPLSYAPSTTPVHSLQPNPTQTLSQRRHSAHTASNATPTQPSTTYKGSPSDKGWIVAKQRLLWPKDLSGTQLCARFALVGSSCPHGYACPYAHKFFPRDFNLDDQKILCKFISSHQPGLSFAPGVRIPSFDLHNKPHSEPSRHANQSILRPRPRPSGIKRPSSPHPEGQSMPTPPKKKVSLTQSS